MAGKGGGRRSLSTSRRDQSRTWPIPVATQDKLLQEPGGFWAFSRVELNKNYHKTLELLRQAVFCGMSKWDRSHTWPMVVARCEKLPRLFQGLEKGKKWTESASNEQKWLQHLKNHRGRTDGINPALGHPWQNQRLVRCLRDNLFNLLLLNTFTDSCWGWYFFLSSLSLQWDALKLQLFYLENTEIFPLFDTPHE